MSGPSATRAFLALLCLAVCLAALYALAVILGAQPLPAILGNAAGKPAALLAAALLAVAGATGAARALTAPPAPEPDDSASGWLIPLMAIFLFVALLAAAIRHEPRLFVMALSLPAGLGAFLTGRYTASLLDDREERLELRHDILGVGGGLGGWRISRSLGAALIALMLGAAALVLALAGVPPAASAGNADGQPAEPRHTAPHTPG